MYDMDFRLFDKGSRSMLDTMHPEDIKAAIRKKFRSLARFERENGLARQSCTEVLRGRPSKRTADAIERALQDETIIPANSESAVAPHRLNAGAR